MGTRWRIRKRTFAHVLTVEGRTDSAHTRAAAGRRADDPRHLPLVRAGARDAPLDAGHPYFYAGWGRDVVGMILDGATDWAEVAELLTESYCVLAPKKLVALVDRPD